MSLPAIEKTWQFNVNNVYQDISLNPDVDDAQELLLLIKAAFLGFASNPWVIDYSCDGTTAGTPGDGVDRWLTIADIELSASEGIAHAWMVLRNPVTGMEILWTMDASNNSARVMNIAWSPSSGFTGGTPTSNPSATDIIWLTRRIGSTPSTNRSYGVTQRGAAQRTAWHMMHSTDGDVTILIFCIDNNTTGFWYLGRPSDPVTGWVNPLVFLCIGKPETSTLTEAVDYDHLMRGADASDTCPRLTANVNNIAEGCRLNVSTYCCNPGSNFTTNVSTLGEAFGTVNEVTMEWDGYPHVLASITSGGRAPIGQMYDIRMASVGLQTGAHGTPTESLTRAVFGALIVPWGGPGIGIPLTA